MDQLVTTALKKLEQLFPELQAVYLFGSAASGRQHSESDMDIGVLCERPLDPIALYNAAQAIAATINRDVDLVDMRAATTVMQEQILSHGKVLCSKDNDARAYFEMYALSDYARLNEERREILKDFYKVEF